MTDEKPFMKQLFDATQDISDHINESNRLLVELQQSVAASDEPTKDHFNMLIRCLGEQVKVNTRIWMALALVGGQANQYENLSAALTHLSTQKR